MMRRIQLPSVALVGRSAVCTWARRAPGPMIDVDCGPHTPLSCCARPHHASTHACLCSAWGMNKGRSRVAARKHDAQNKCGIRLSVEPWPKRAWRRARPLQRRGLETTSYSPPLLPRPGRASLPRPRRARRVLSRGWRGLGGAVPLSDPLGYRVVHFCSNRADRQTSRPRLGSAVWRL